MLRSALGNAPDANRKAFWGHPAVRKGAALNRVEARGDLRADFNHGLVLGTLVGLLIVRNFLTGKGPTTRWSNKQSI